jgi:D-aspartate ligase
MKISLKADNPGAIIIEGHVQGLSNTRSLGEAGIPIFVVDKINCLARYSKYCKKFFYCPDFLSEEFVVFLLNLAEEESIKNWVLIPSNDHAVYSISKNKKRLEKYYKIITPGIDIIEKMYDKTSLLAIAERAEVAYPVTQYFKSANDIVNDSLKFPVITKGRNGLTFYKTIGKKVLLAGSEAELRKQLSQLSTKMSIEETFTQELIPFERLNKTISFTAFCLDGEIKTHWIGEKVREHPIRFGTGTFARSINCEALFESSKTLLNSLKYTGVCEIEYLLDPRDRKYKLIEINARTWLWVGLAKNCGINYSVLLYNFQNGIENNYPGSYDNKKEWMHYLADLPFSIIGLLKREYTLKEIFLSYLRFPSPAVFSLNDILPALAEILLLPMFIFKR